MSVSVRPFFTAQYAPAAQTTLYTTSGVRAIVDKFTAYNGTAGAVPLAVNIVPNAGTVGPSNLVVSKSIAAGETYNFPEVVGHTLEQGASISVVAGTATALVIRAGGREVS